MKYWIAICLSLVVTGCHTVTVIPSDKAVHWLNRGETYTATNRVCVVPEARMQQILRKLNQP